MENIINDALKYLPKEVRSYVEENVIITDGPETGYVDDIIFINVEGKNKYQLIDELLHEIAHIQSTGEKITNTIKTKWIMEYIHKKINPNKNWEPWEFVYLAENC